MNPAINLIHLKFFCDAIVYESISEAAKMNFISQSAVSQAISKLESIFQAELIFHNRQKVQPTEEGLIVFEQSREIFRNVKETFDKVNSTKPLIAGNLRFVTTKSLGMSFIAPSYIKLKKNLPKLNFKFKMGGLNFIRTALRREEAEFAIVVYDQNFDQFEKLPLKKGRFRLYKSQNASPELIQDGIFVEDLEGPYVKEISKFLADRHFQNPINDVLAGWELTARFTQLGIGIGFFPDYILSNNRYPNIEIHPLEIPEYGYEICAIYNKGVKLSRSAQYFIEQFTLDY